MNFVSNKEGFVVKDRIFEVRSPNGEPSAIKDGWAEELRLSKIDEVTVGIPTLGEVSFGYANSVDSAARALISFDLGNDALPLDYGITDFTFPNPRMFYRGSWNGTIALVT